MEMHTSHRMALTFALAMLLQLARAQDDGSGPSSDPSNTAIYAHGILMAIAFGILLPTGAAIMHTFRFKGFVWFHAGWQIFTYLIVLAGFGLGVWIAVQTDQLVVANGHPIIGLIVVIALFFQPFGGWLAHRLFTQQHRKTIVHIVHRWVGRVFIVLGAINAGLGLQLSGNSDKGEIAYGTVAGVFFLLWFGTWLFDVLRKKKADKYAEEMQSLRS